MRPAPGVILLRMSIADSISLGCWRDGDSERFANLLVRDDVGERSVHGAGLVDPDCRLDCESETVAEAHRQSRRHHRRHPHHRRVQRRRRLLASGA